MINIVIKNVANRFLSFSLYFSYKYIISKANSPIKLHIAPVIPLNK